jgi:hypothetical protein
LQHHIFPFQRICLFSSHLEHQKSTQSLDVFTHPGSTWNCEELLTRIGCPRSCIHW